jgi:uncharacterized membrane protein (DUF373 family)
MVIKKTYNKWFKIIGLISSIAITTTIFIYIANKSTTYIISKGFTAGAASGIIVGAIVREKTKKKFGKKENILGGIAILAILLILGWSFYSSMILDHDLIYQDIEDLACGILFILPLYLVMSFYICKNVDNS